MFPNTVIGLAVLNKPCRYDRRSEKVQPECISNCGEAFRIAQVAVNSLYNGTATWLREEPGKRVGWFTHGSKSAIGRAPSSRSGQVLVLQEHS